MSEAYAPDGPLSPPQPPKAPHPYSSHKSAGQYSLWGQKFSTGPDPSPVWKFPALPGFPRPALRATGGIPAALFPSAFASLSIIPLTSTSKGTLSHWVNVPCIGTSHPFFHNQVLPTGRRGRPVPVSRSFTQLCFLFDCGQGRPAGRIRSAGLLLE